MVSDLPDFYRGTSPGFGMAREGQVLTRIAWSGNIVAGASQVNTNVVTLPNYLFTIDAIHLFSRKIAPAVTLNPGPFRYLVELDFSVPPAPSVWVPYYNGWVEASSTLRLFHVTGAGIQGVYGFRETIYNDSDMSRYFESYIYYLYNEVS
jgi:hypothetical protein